MENEICLILFFLIKLSLILRKSVIIHKCGMWWKNNRIPSYLDLKTKGMKCFSGEDLSQNCESFSVVVVGCELLLVCTLWPGLSSDEGACGLKREGRRRGVGRMRGMRCRA